MSTQLLEGLAPSSQLLLQLAVRHEVAPVHFARVPPLDEADALIAVEEVQQRGLLKVSEAENLLLLTPIGLALEDDIRAGWPALHAALRPRLIEHVQRMYGLADDAPVLRALSRVDRAGFLPDGSLPLADLDIPAPIGVGEMTTSAPHAVVAILGSVLPTEGQRVLVCGAKGGVTAAMSAHMVGPAGAVLCLDDQEEVATYAAERVLGAGEGAAPIEVRHVPDVTLGAAEAGPFDIVIVNGSVPKIPRDLLSQLAPSGRMLLFLQEALVSGQSCFVVSRNGKIRKDELLSRFVFTPIYGRWGWDRLHEIATESGFPGVDDENS